jgi:hypothetical protein
MTLPNGSATAATTIVDVGGTGTTFVALAWPSNQVRASKAAIPPITIASTSMVILPLRTVQTSEKLEKHINENEKTHSKSQIYLPHEGPQLNLSQKSGFFLAN